MYHTKYFFLAILFAACLSMMTSDVLPGFVYKTVVWFILCFCFGYSVGKAILTQNQLTNKNKMNAHFEAAKTLLFEGNWCLR